MKRRRTVGDFHFSAFEEKKVEEVDFSAEKRFGHDVGTRVVHGVDVCEKEETLFVGHVGTCPTHSLASFLHLRRFGKPTHVHVMVFECIRITLCGKTRVFIN